VTCTTFLLCLILANEEGLDEEEGEEEPIEDRLDKDLVFRT
jgi:hypothetical protein